MTSVGVIDHGAGNIVSMVRALETVGADPTVVISGSLDMFDRVVLPGVGATGPAMQRLAHTGLADAVRQYDGPLLGVCVGMQLLFDYSTEDATRCLGLLRGSVERIDASPLPHIGWNEVRLTCDEPDDDPINGALFYFVHSFAVRPTSPTIVAGVTDYQEDRFASMVTEGRISGVQFHPERSGASGLALLERFASTGSVIPAAAPSTVGAHRVA